MSVENLNVFTESETDRVLKLAETNPQKFKGLMNKTLSQAESQKIIIIEKILRVIDNNELNTTQIKEKTSLSWTTVVRTLKLFREKNIVKVKTIKDKQNNEKIYSLNKDRAIWYLSHSLLLKGESRWIKIFKTNKKMKNLKKMVPEWFWEHELILSKELQEVYEQESNKIKMKNLVGAHLREITLSYHRGNLCYDCFDKGYLRTLEGTVEDTLICNVCHREYPDSLIQLQAESFRKKLWDIEKKIHDIENKHNMI